MKKNKYFIYNRKFPLSQRTVYVTRNMPLLENMDVKRRITRRSKGKVEF